MSEKKIKIGLVIEYLNLGGMETEIVRYYPRLNRDRFEAVVICFSHPGVLAEELTRQGISVISRMAQAPPVPQALQNPRGDWEIFKGRIQSLFQRLLKNLKIVIWIARVLKREQIDLAHFFLPNAYVLGTLASLGLPGIKRIMSRSSLNFYHREKPLYRFLECGILHRFSHRVVGNSRAILDQLRQEGVDSKNLRLLYNGIDLDSFLLQPGSRVPSRQSLSLPENAFVMVAVGNLYTFKGHGELIEACNLAAQHLPENWLLLIAGRDQNNNRAQYENLIRERALDGHIRFLGQCLEVPPLLFAGDVFVHPSHHEGFPNAILEAMAASLPVAASRVGGIPEQIVAGPPGFDPFQSFPDETGWLVPPENPEALAQALVASSQDAERRREMGERGCRRVKQNFSIEKTVNAYETLYQELASET